MSAPSLSAPPASTSRAAAPIEADAWTGPTRSALGWIDRTEAVAAETPMAEGQPLPLHVREALHELETLETRVSLLREELTAAEAQRADILARLVVAAHHLIGDGRTAPRAETSEALADAEPTPGRGTEPWSRPALAFDDTALDTAVLSDGEPRLVALGGTLTPEDLRAQVPEGWSVQPTDDRPGVHTALVYRATEPAIGVNGMLGRGLALVDALATLDASGTLTPELHAALIARMTDLRAVSPLDREHLEARAQWRRSVPAVHDDIRTYLDRSGSRGSRHLAEWLVSIVGEDSPHRTATVDLSHALQGTLAPRPVESIEVAAVAEAATVETSREVVPVAVAPTPARLSAEDPTLDGVRSGQNSLAEKRASTDHALAALAEFAPDDEQLDDEAPKAPSTVDVEVVLGASATALLRKLAGAEQHPLVDVFTWAHELDVMPLSAVRTINEWAEHRMADRGTPLDVPLIEVDERGKTVYVDDSAKELIS